MKVLVINCGSSSLKYQLIDMNNETVLAKGNCERIGIAGFIGGKTHDGRSFEKTVTLKNHTEAFQYVKRALLEGSCKVIDSINEISAAGHRIVQGGALFDKSCLVTDEVINGIESLVDLAPLHNAAHLQGIRACQDVFGKQFPQVVVFDNCFHLTMPPEAYMFALPYEYYEKYKIRRYGFHGTSHRYVSARCTALMGGNAQGLKVITCHIGNGSSISAIKDGKVMDTSMGLTPLDGFMMGTRTGSLDPSVVTYIMQKENLDANELCDLFNKKSGMLGISGVSSDDRDITAAIEQGNERAMLARRMQFYQIRKFIGSYVAAMNGVDAIVFTGGIGEHSFKLREDVCKNLTFMGVDIDTDRNNAVKGEEIEISSDNSKVKVFVIPTNEELVIARDTKQIVEAL